MGKAKTNRPAGIELPVGYSPKKAESWRGKERRAARGLLALVQNASYMYAVQVYDVRFTRRDEGWLVMVKGKRYGAYLIAFFNAPRFAEALIYVATSMDSKHVDWFEDRYPPKETV